MASAEEKKYASLKGAEQGYVPKGKEFRQEIRQLKKIEKGGGLSTRQAHRLHYLKELRSRRVSIGTVKTIGEVVLAYFTAGGFQLASGAVKAGGKLITKEVAKAAAKKLAKRAVLTAAAKGATAIAQSKMKKKMGEASSRADRAEAFGDYGGAQDIRRAGAHYTPGLEAAIPLATSAAMAGAEGKFKKPEQPSMTGLDEIIGDYEGPKASDFGLKDYDPMSDLTEIAQPEEIFDDSITSASPVSDPTSFPGARDWLGLQRDKSFARRKGIDPTEFVEEPGFEFPEPDPEPLPLAPPPSPLDVESYEEYNLPIPQTLGALPLEQIPSDITAPELTASTQELPPQQPTRSTLEELTRTEYEDIVDKIEAGPSTATTAASVSDEDLLSMENANGMGTYQDMFDQYKENTDFTDEEIMENVRRSATLSGEFGVDIDSVDVEANERQRFIDENYKEYTMGPMKGQRYAPTEEVVRIHMKNWEAARPERERNARIIAARQQAETLLGEYDIPFDPNEPTPNISYRKGGKLQDHMGSIKATRKYMMNKYA